MVYRTCRLSETLLYALSGRCYFSTRICFPSRIGYTFFTVHRSLIGLGYSIIDDWGSNEAIRLKIIGAAEIVLVLVRSVVLKDRSDHTTGVTVLQVNQC